MHTCMSYILKLNCLGLCCGKSLVNLAKFLQTITSVPWGPHQSSSTTYVAPHGTYLVSELSQPLLPWIYEDYLTLKIYIYILQRPQAGRAGQHVGGKQIGTSAGELREGGADYKPGRHLVSCWNLLPLSGNYRAVFYLSQQLSPAYLWIGFYSTHKSPPTPMLAGKLYLPQPEGVKLDCAGLA